MLVEGGRPYSPSYQSPEDPETLGDPARSRLVRCAPAQASPKIDRDCLLQAGYQIDMLPGMSNPKISVLHSAAWFEQEIRERAVDTANVIFTDHARERLNQRSITPDEAIRVLRQGQCADPPPERGHDPGEWRGKILSTVGGRTLSVAVAATANDMLVVVTAWEQTGGK